MNSWHTQGAEKIREHFQVPETGLTAEQAEKNRGVYGANVLPEPPSESLALLFLRQFQSPLIYILLVVSIIIFLIGDHSDAIIILLLLLFNATVGTIQEGRAHNTLASLKKFAEANAVVVRGGIEEIIPDREVVAGDIIILREGSKVPADARIAEAAGLTVDEAALTGESQPVYKISNPLPNPSLPLAERKNMVFKGTAVMAGYGQAIVVAVGPATVIGSISQKISTIRSEDPLKRDIRKLSRAIIVAVIIICGGMFALGVASGQPLKNMFTTVVSLSVSVIPEGLPIVLTLVLATGVWRMSKRNVLVKKLQAVESLGQAKIIAADKTGTITKNELVVQQIYIDGKNYSVDGTGYDPHGAVWFNRVPLDPKRSAPLQTIARATAFAAGAKVSFNEDNQSWQVSGDPTEAALLVLAEKLGLRKDEIEQKFPQIAEIPFSYQNKFHAVVHKTGDISMITVVGAPEAILERCDSLWRAQERRSPANELTNDKRQILEQQLRTMSSHGLRVVAAATAAWHGQFVKPEDITGLTLLGLIGMKDSLRPEVKDALARAREAGMKVVMITGDHKLTAEAIAKEAGIFTVSSKTLSGEDIEKLSDAALAETLPDVAVFARVTPEHKLRIIEAYKARGEIIAMTGDGVNDAPSLVAADLGVAMGKIGTEVAKEAADIVLLDDNFGSIVSAVEEGRSIYKTIKKVMLYLFSTSAGEVLAIAGAIIIGLPLPVVAAQIIWLNFVTDGFLDVSLAMEPKERGLLHGSYAIKKYSLVDSMMLERMVFMAAPMGIGTIWLFGQYAGGDPIKANTIALCVLAVFQWFNAWNCRNERESIFKMNPFSNKFLVGATLTVIVLQLLAVYNPFMQKFLHTTALSVSEWAVIVLVAFSIVIVEELRKYFSRKQRA